MINSIKYYLDKMNSRDLILTGSRDNHLKLWEYGSFENILDINCQNEVVSSCLVYDKNEIFLVSSHNNDIKAL